MAEAVIGSLVLKIGAALADEGAKSAVSLLLTWISAMKELKKDISEIKAELRGMQSFLQNAERLKKRDKNINTFIEEIRELAFDIEDIIDEFTYKLGEEQRGVLPTTIKRCKNIITWHHLSKRVKDSKTSLHNITARKDRYNIGSNENKPSPSIAKGGSNSPAEYAHFFKEDDLEGIDENKDLLLRLLKDEEQQNMIISVWGMGGLGKTTLATHVYNIIKTTFDACAWVPVSQNYNTNDLLRQIIKEFCREEHNKIAISENVDDMDCRSLVQTICNLLRNKRYVIILDDVWSIKAWFDIKHAFLDGNNNSKIVLTTRIYEVALLAHEHCMLELKPLEADHSWNLFCKNAFWNNTDRICPPQLKHWAEKIVEKCCGLPLAIVSIGSLLSCKEQLDTEWENVYKDLEWHLTGNSTLDERVNNILELSLEDLPHYLRNCFLYCCIFSEDHRIKRKRLIRLWVAEGFIEERENRTMEEVAEDYLNELVHRCLLQAVVRNVFGRVRRCRMHDIVRVLALSKSEEESFYMVYKHLSTSQGCKARRTSVTSGAIEHWKEDKSHLRSLLLLNSSMNCDLLKSASKSSKFLCVLDLQGSSIEKVPSEIGNLFNLRFLGLRETKIEKLPKSIGKLQNLQTLDAYDTNIKRLPEEVANLRKLRHLFVLIKRNMIGNKVVFFVSVPTPKGIWHLKDLQTLQIFEANSEMVKEVGVLINLRTFCITEVRTCHCADLCRAITNMNHLVHLDIAAKGKQEILHLGALRLPRSIQKLFLQGQLDKKYSLPELSMSFGSITNLTILRLRWSGLVEDPLPYIQALPRLMVLILWEAYDGIKLCFKTASFPTLKELRIRGAPRLNQIEIEKEALPSIQILHLFGCPELKVLPQGIEHLTTLQELILERPAEELVARLRRGGEEGGDESHEDLMKMRHIPKVIHIFKGDDGKWADERLIWRMVNERLQ